MGLLALGINHKTASVSLREKVAFNPEKLVDALREACVQADIRELAILSTCNRTEFYCLAPDQHQDALLAWLGRHHHISLTELSQCIYAFEDVDAVRHMMRVAAGLDSMILGEPQILGQMKDAYSMAVGAGTVGSELERLFQTTFSTAKQVRTETAIGANPVSVGFTAVQLARQIFSDLSETRALLVGAGETIELVGRHLFEQGVKGITVANRTLSRGLALAEQFGGKAVSLEDIPEALVNADIVISSTASPLPIIGKGMAERALKKRRHKPIFMVDIAVPRDIEPEVGELNDVYLYTVDDLQTVIDENLRSRQEAARAAEKIVEERAQQFLTVRRGLDAVGALRAYREQVDQLREQEVSKALESLQHGASAEEVIQRLGRALSSKIAHMPTIKMKQAAANAEYEKLTWAAELLGIEAAHESNENTGDIRAGQHNGEPHA